jgi:hypothetical protein
MPSSQKTKSPSALLPAWMWVAFALLAFLAVHDVVRFYAERHDMTLRVNIAPSPNPQ